jgi:hypothetical protein
MTPETDKPGVPVLQATDEPPPAPPHWWPSDVPVGIVSVVIASTGMLAFGAAIWRWVADPYLRWLIANDPVSRRQVLLLSLGALTMIPAAAGGILLLAKRRSAWFLMIVYGATSIIVGLAMRYDERHIPAVIGNEVLNTIAMLLFLAVFPAMMLVWFSLPRVRARFHQGKDGAGSQ